MGLFLLLLVNISCEKSQVEADFKDRVSFTIYDYLNENKAEYSDFIAILKAGGIDKTLGAYNPNGVSYTLFLPGNEAIENFLKSSSQYNTLDDILNDQTFVPSLARIHVLNSGIKTYDFPYGRFSETALSGDYLNVRFTSLNDTIYYTINNQAKVIKANIELSNGYIQVVDNMLIPITQNSYNWLKNNLGYSIFLSAIDATGYDSIIDVDLKTGNNTLKPFTLLVEPDSVYRKKKVNSFADLANIISPERMDYYSHDNPMKLFVGYHILDQIRYLNDLSGVRNNYNTFADIPVSIDGTGFDIIINKGKEILDSIVTAVDTTIIDFIGINYDASNIITQSGVIHFIDHILKPQVPSRILVTFDFSEEPTLQAYRLKGGAFIIKDHNLLSNLTWTGAELNYVKSMDPLEAALNQDYLEITGDFMISYVTPKIIAGRYMVLLDADGYNSENSVIELFVDGVKLGGLINLTSGGNANNPYVSYNCGIVDFSGYDTHEITIISLIPGRFVWDYIKFQPSTL
jgi:uncharacterized surface protein with fasciclin (FAS1) repeats